MSTNQLRKFEMLVRASTFGSTHSDLFPPASLGGQKFKELGVSVDLLREQAIAKQASAKAGRKAKRRAREALLQQIDAIRQSARGMSVSNPGFEDAYQMPRSISDAAIATTAHTFLREAELAKELFVRYQMPPDFLTQLAECVNGFDTACRDHQVTLETLRAARSGTERALESGLMVVEELDTIVRNALSKDPVTLSVWEEARRIDYSRRTRRAAATPAASIETPVVAPPAAETPAPTIAAPVLEKAS